ncbi:NusA-like transcription termination signal-binding factor [Candidatus Woesearchaeota archaeon]|nr:NusA-like transcription termination signal-binding factor [Candidatus Woesearchaeota archaeon]
MIEYSAETIGYINFFENVTKAKVKDCFIENSQLVFVVQSGEMAKALGKNGSHVKKVGNLLKKSIKVIEFSPDSSEFLKRIIKPIIAEVEIKEGVALIKTNNNKEKGMLFGRDKQNLKKLHDLMKRYFNLDVKIV